MVRTTRRTFAALLALLALAAACAKAPPSLSPVGVIAFNQTRLIKGLDLLRDTAIAAHAQTPPLLSEADTGKVVRYHKLTLLALHDGASPATLRTGLDDLLKDLPDKDAALLRPYVGLLKAVIDEVLR